MWVNKITTPFYGDPFFCYHTNYMNSIVITNLSKSYGANNKRVHVVRDLSLTIPCGTVFGFIGPNGAGKTSTIKMLVGLSTPTSGSITIHGESPSSHEVHKHIGFMPESPLFYQYLTGYEFLDFIATLFGITDKDNRITYILTEVNLLHARDKKIQTYSKGMLQRLGLAQALINDPAILFLDEPLDGLDPLGRAEVKKIIVERKKEGKTIFINTHILGDVAEICDMVGIIDKGTLIRTDTPQAIAQGFRDLEEAFVHIIEERRKEEHSH